MPSRQGVYTPSRALSQQEFNMQRTATRESPKEHGQDVGRRPQHSRRPPEGSLQGKRALIPAPKAHADARRPCVLPRTQFGNPKHSDREPGPIPGGWASLTIPPSDEIPAGEFNGIPGQMNVQLGYLYMGLKQISDYSKHGRYMGILGPWASICSIWDY